MDTTATRRDVASGVAAPRRWLRASVACLSALLAALLFAGTAVAADDPAPTVAVADRFGRAALEHLRRGQTPELRAQLDASLYGADNARRLRELAGRFPTGEPESITLIGRREVVRDAVWSASLTFEYRFADGWALGQSVLRSDADGLRVIGMNVVRTEGAQAELNRFTLEGRSATHYAVLVLVIAVPVFIIVSLLACLRSPPPGRRWLWLVFVSLGMGAVQLNWTSGAVDVHLLSLNVLGTGAVSYGDHSPWLLQFGVPVGAIVYWVKRRRRHDRAKPVDGPDDESAPGSDR